MKTILAIDDQPDNLATIRAVIKSFLPKYNIITALSGKEGIALAKINSPDTIILDIQMPEMDGFEVCKLLKSDPLTKHIPVIFLTAVKTDSKSRIKGLDSGADAFLSKPFDSAELIAQVNVMLRIKNAEDQLRNENENLEKLVLERTSKLTEAEEKYRALYENAPLPYQSLSDDGTFRDINPAWLSALGFNRDEVIGKKFRDFLHPDYVSHFDINFPLFKKRGYVKDVLFKLKHKNGTYLDVSFNGCIGYTPKGQFKQTYCVFQNITEKIAAEKDKKSAQEALLWSNKVNSSITNTANDAIITINSIGEVLSWNRSAERIFGYSAKEKLNTLLNDIIPEYFIKDHTDGLKRMIEDRFERIIGKTIEITAVNKDKHEFPIELSLAKWEVEGQKYYTGIVKDISKRKKRELLNKVLYNISKAAFTADSLENLIKNIHVELANVIDTTNFFVALYNEKDDTFNLPLFVDKFDKMSSFPAQQTLSNYVVKTQKPLIANREKVDELVSLGHVSKFGADSAIWLGVPMIVESKVTGALVVQSYDNPHAFDESDLKILEFISHQVSVSIERKKAEEDLKVALENATESDRLKSAFLSNMSHEIRTPMNGILGFLSLLKEPDITGEERLEFMELIEKSSVRMINTIKDLMDISMIESNQVKVNIKPVNIDRLLEDIYLIYQSEAEEKGLQLILSKKAFNKKVVVQTDPEKLTSILNSLLRNAIKYSSEGIVEIAYGLKENNIQFVVKDHGMGIHKDRIEAIFERFVQAETEDHLVFEGSGLGLSIAKAYVELLNGKIWVESELGKGSSFYFTIPRVSENQADKFHHHSLTKDQKGKLKILIAEDEEFAEMHLTLIVKTISSEILYAKNGSTAVEICRDNPDINLILMDMKMPITNGFDATRQIRSFNESVIIIAQTAYALEGDQEKTLAAGCNDYISKPIDKNKLLELIFKHFEYLKDFKKVYP